MKPSEILGKACDLLDAPNAHLRHSLARDANDEPCLPTDPEACQFCLVGAVLSVIEDGSRHVGSSRYALYRAFDESYVGPLLAHRLWTYGYASSTGYNRPHVAVYDFNDMTPGDEVRKLVRSIAADLRNEGQ